jgi:hypothetical protein
MTQIEQDNWTASPWHDSQDGQDREDGAVYDSKDSTAEGVTTGTG